MDAVYVNARIAEHEDQFFKDELDVYGLLAEPDRRTIDIDLHAADDTVKLAIYWMRKDAMHGRGRGGSIVMTASLAGYLASAGASLYSAAKHGIVGLMRALKNDLVTVGIAISIVAPGITKLWDLKAIVKWQWKGPTGCMAPTLTILAMEFPTKLDLIPEESHPYMLGDQEQFAGFSWNRDEIVNEGDLLIGQLVSENFKI